jgi:tetratricopeptide (TPR) repeat protein/DNA-binding CsgD family transcriptional regulator
MIIRYSSLIILFHLYFVINITAQAEDTATAIKKYQSDVIAAEKSGDKQKIAKALGRLSFEQAMNNNFVEATTNVERAITLFQALNDKIGEARCYGTLIAIHETMHNYDKEEEYALKAYSIAAVEKDTLLLTSVCDALGSVYHSKKDFQKSLKYYLESLRYAEQNGSGTGAIRSNLCSVYKELGEWEKGLESANLAVKALLEEGDTLRYTTALYNQALFNGHFKRFEIAEKQMQEGNALVKYMGIPDVERDMHLAHAIFFQQKGDWKNALIAQKMYHAADSSLTSESHHLQFAAFETAFKTKEKEQENLVLSQKVQRQYLIFGGIVLGLLSLLGAIYFQRKRLIIKNKILAQEQHLAQNVLHEHIEMLKEKTNVIEQLSDMLSKNDSSKEKEETIAQLLNASILTEEQWVDFRYKFERVHQDFFQKLQENVPDATEAEKRLAALTKLNLSGTQIASMLGISPDSVVKTRYRLRKKIETGNSLEGVLAEI